jgi:hypothetical protein
MSTTGSVHAEQLNNQDLSVIARAHWRELKAQLPDSQNKSSMQAIIDELTYRAENDPSQGQQFQKSQHGGGISGQFSPQQQQTQRGQTTPQFAGVGGGQQVPHVS